MHGFTGIGGQDANGLQLLGDFRVELFTTALDLRVVHFLRLFRREKIMTRLGLCEKRKTAAAATAND